MAEYAINGDIATLLGGDHTTGDPAALWLESSEPILVIDSEGRTGGKVRVPLNADGTFTVTGLPETVSGASPLYRLHVDSLSLRQAGQRKGMVTGWFPLATNRDLTWIVANYVQASLITAQVAADIAAAAALGATNDTAVASYVNNPASAAGSALAAKYVGAVVITGAGIDPTGATDSAAAIQAKINTAATLGAKAYLPEGTYTLATRLNLPTNTELEGAGHTSVLHFTMTTVAENCIQNTDYAGASGGNTNIRIRNLTIQGSGDGTPSGGGTVVSGIIFRHCTDVEITGCKFYRVQGVSVGWQGVARGRFANNVVHEGGRGGFVVWGHGTIVRTEDIACVGNTFYKLGDDAIAAQGNSPATSAAAQPRRFTFTGNTVYGASSVDATPAGRGVLIRGVAEVVISNNTISDTAYSGIYLSHDDQGGVWNSVDVAITGNTVLRSGSTGDATQPRIGIRCDRVVGLIVAGNNIGYGSESGISLSIATDFSVSNNNIHDNGTTDAHFGITLAGSASLDVQRGVIQGNTILRNAGSGIKALNTNHLTVSGNTILDNGSYTAGAVSARSALQINTTGAATVSGNTMTDTRGAGSKTQTYAIHLTAAMASLTLTGNNMEGNSTGSIALGATPTVYIKRGNYESATARINYDQNAGGTQHYTHTATPEAVITAPPGSLCTTTGGGLYVKQTGTGNTGWVLK